MILGLQERFVSKAAILGLDQEKHQECCVPLLAGKCQQLPAGFTMAVRLLSPTPAQESVITFPFCSNYDLCCSLWWFSFAKPFNSLPPLFLYKGKKYFPRAYMLFFSMIRKEAREKCFLSDLLKRKLFTHHSSIPSLSPALLLFLLRFLFSKNVLYDLY